MKRTSRKPWLHGAVHTALLVGGLAGGLQAQQTRPPGVDLANLDRSVRPQDDFYRFVNGTWLRNTAIPSDRVSFGSFIQLRDRSEDARHVILQELVAARDVAAGTDRQKLRDLYLAYMDTARIERLGLEPLRPELARIAALTGKEQLPELFAQLRRIGVSTPVAVSVGQNQKKADEYIVYVGQSGLGLPDRDYYLKQDARFGQVRTAYLGYIETLLRLAGQRDPAGAARRIVALEDTIARAQWDRARSRDRDATYNLRTVAQLDSMTPAFSFSRMLRASGVERTPGVVVRQPDYLAALNRMVERTPTETWREYLTFKLLDSYSPLLPREFGNANFAFRGRELQGQQAMRPRWKLAVGATEDALGEAMGRLYVERNFRPEAKARMERLVANLMTAFRQGVDELEWMSPATREQARDKLSKIRVKIGYPEKWRDYSALEVRPGEAVGNAMRSARFDAERMAGRLGKPVDRAEWGMTPQTVNAYYSSTMNEIVFPAAILQPPFFDMNADDAVNYGAIGGVIGHEISHGFDDQGRRSDGEGNLRDWWTAEDNDAFKQRADALVAQYNAFQPLEGQSVNGRLTLGENIGDLSGLAVAYRAYKLATQGQPQRTIDGFTPDQRFFLGWGQVWRTKFRDEALRQQLLTDSHSPGEYRTNGVLVNMPEFYEAFGVKEGDKMYVAPEKRVKIW